MKIFPALSCGMMTGAGAILNVAEPGPGSSIVIFGGGAVGLSAVLAARLSNPSTLILVDNSQSKLDMIPKDYLEGVRTINSANKSTQELANEIKALTPNNYGVDFALDCVGNENVIAAAHAALDKLGMLVIVGGGGPHTKLPFAISAHLIKGAVARGTHQGDSVSRLMIPKLIELWRQGRFPFEKMLAYFKFGELAKALEEIHAGRVIKAVLVLDE
jgi:aryl-alcohol dehydrogenase